MKFKMTVYTNDNTRNWTRVQKKSWILRKILSRFLEKFMTRTVTRTECVKL